METPRLILTDLDGTLLRNDKRLSPANRDALTRAAAQGCMVVISTGRSYTSMPAEVRELPFLRYFIFMNGARIYDREADRILFQADLDAETTSALIELLDPLDLSLDYYQNDQGYMDRRYYDRLDYYVADPIARAHSRNSRRPIDNYRDAIAAGGGRVQKFQCFFPHREDIAPTAALISRRFPELELSSSLPGNLEINAPGATKGAALVTLCRALGLAPADAVAFGDGTNDLTMLRAAGLGVAMANGAAEVLAAADLVAPCNEEDGVAQVLARWF